jgi:hypothetical protein
MSLKFVSEFVYSVTWHENIMPKHAQSGSTSIMTLCLHEWRHANIMLHTLGHPHQFIQFSIYIYLNFSISIYLKQILKKVTHYTNPQVVKN